MKQCGACCYLGTDQPDLEFLQDEDMRLQYKAMVGNVRAKPSSVDSSFRALFGRLKLTVRRHEFDEDSLFPCKQGMTENVLRTFT